MKKEEIKKVNSAVEELFTNLDIIAKVKVDFDKVANLINVQIDSEEAANLIGFHGETLRALQLMISFLVHKTLGNWIKVLVNVGDYRQKREEQLRRLAMNLAMKAKFSGEPQAVPNLLASERRTIHLILADHPDVYTQSEGEGKQRQLTIRPKK